MLNTKKTSVTTRHLMMCLVVCGFAMSSTAQDSTSVLSGLPGDAPDAYDLNDQCADYVVDLVPISTTWGNQFTVGPLLKSSRTAPGLFFNNLTSSNGVSATYATTSFSGQGFAVWNGPGFGVSSGDNNTANTQVIPTGPAVQFGAVALDFSNNSGSTANTESIVGATVRVDPTQPTRLFVQRRIAAVNGNNSAESKAAFGVGSINEQGQIAFRADNDGAFGPDAIVGNNLFVVNLLNRNCGIVNVINATGGADSSATQDVLRGNSVIHTTPSILPASVRAGTIYTGNFNRELMFGDSTSTAVTTAHRVGTTDQRGSTSFSPVQWFAGSAGTGSILSKPSEVTDSSTQAISYWGVNGSTGGVAAGSSSKVVFPAGQSIGGSVIDNFDGFQVGLLADPQSDWEFSLYDSQATFRGGNGRIGVNTDSAGRLILAAVASDTSIGGRATSPVNTIAVARVSPAGTTEWTLAAWTDLLGPDGGKAITNGQGNTVGYLAELSQLTGGSPLGPSMSSPVVDSEGNIWFIGSARFEIPGNPGTFELDAALLRAVYDASSFSYELESVLRVGDIVRGVNSDRDYRINFLEIADSNSISSSTLTSNSIIHDQWLGGSAQLAKGDPRALGGLVFATTILYDANDDGQFISPTGQNGDPTSDDEIYEVLMFLGVNAQGGPAECIGDFADDFGTLGSDGQVSFGDFLALLGLIGPCPGGTPGCIGDIADDFGTLGGDGQVSFGDFLALLGLIGPCP
jgi:hypothetical protein